MEHQDIAVVNALPPVEGEHALWAGTHFGNIGLAKSLKNETKDIRHLLHWHRSKVNRSWSDLLKERFF